MSVLKCSSSLILLLVSMAGPEIWTATEGKVDIFVAVAGTGGTVSGTGHYLKGMNPEIKVVAVEPAESPVMQGE